MFDHLRIALHFTHQRMQAGEAQADDLLPVRDGLASVAAGIGSLTGIAGHLLNGRFQFAERITDHGRVTGLMFGAAVQVIAQLCQGSAAAGDLLGVEADGAHQIHQIGAQAIERGFDVLQFAVGFAQLNVATEIAFGPGGQGRSEVGQGSGQLALQGVDEQGDQQNQADHHALHQSHFALDLSVLGAYHGLKTGDRLLYGGDFQVGRGTEVGAFLDLLAGARQFRRVAGEEAVQFTLEADAGIFRNGFFSVFQPHHGGEIIRIRFSADGHAQQWQGIQLLSLGTDVGDFALDIGSQFAAAAADQFVAGQGKFAQVLGGGEQWCQVSRVATGVLAELVKAGAEFPFGLQQQGLRVSREFAGGEQVGFAEFVQGRQAGRKVSARAGGNSPSSFCKPSIAWLALLKRRASPLAR